MSAFGDGTFKQVVLDMIQDEITCYFKKNYMDAIPELMEVFSYILTNAPYRDEAIIKARTEAYHSAKQELLEKLNK